MSNIIDNRIVKMEFDNAAFEKGIKQTTESLTNLDKTIDRAYNNGRTSKLASIFSNIEKLIPVDSIANAARGIADGIGTIFSDTAHHVSTLSKVGIGAIAAIGAAIKGLTISGGMRRALNIEQAKFQLTGLGVSWDQVYDDLDYAVSGTAYGLDSAAKAASQLVASNVAVGDSMKTALRGISGVAAMTNREYDEVAHIFTTVAGTGKMMGMQLTQLGTYGINAASAIAKYFREVRGESETTEETIRDMASKGKIDFATFAEAMDWNYGEHAKAANDTFTGSMANTKAALSRIGAEFATPYMDNMKDVFNALIPFLNMMKKSMTPIFGEFSSVMASGKNAIVNFLEPFTRVEEVYNDFTGEVIERTDWSAVSIRALSNSFTGLISLGHSIFGPFGKSFGEMMDGLGRYFNNGSPITLGPQTLLDISHAIENVNKVVGQLDLGRFFDALLGPVWTEGMQLKQIFDSFASSFSDVDLSSVFNGFVDVFEVVMRVVSDALTIWNHFISNGIAMAAPVIKDIANLIHDFALAFDEVFRGTNEYAPILDDILGFMDGLRDGFLDWYEEIRKLLPTLSDFSSILDVIKGALSVLGGGIETIADFFSKTLGSAETVDTAASGFDKLGQALKFVLEQMRGMLEESGLIGVIQNLADNLAHLSLGNLSATFAGGMIVQGLRVIHNMLSMLTADASQISKYNFPSLMRILGLGPVLDKTRTALIQFSALLNAEAIKQVAKSLLILAAALLVMSLIPAPKLILASTAMLFLATVLTKVFGSLAALGSNDPKNLVAIRQVTSSLLVLSGSFAIMAVAMKILSSMGSGTVAAVIGMVVLVGSLLSIIAVIGETTKEASLAKGGALMVGLGFAILQMSVAMKILSSISYDGLASALASMALIGVIVASVIAISGSMKNASGILASAVLFATIGGAFVLLAASMKILSSMDMAGLGTSVLAMSAIFIGLIGMFAILKTVHYSSLLGAAVVFSNIGNALLALGATMKVLSAISSDSMGNAIAGLAATLLLLIAAVAALGAMEGMAIRGASALAVVAVSLLVMAPALAMLAAMPMAGIIAVMAGLILLVGTIGFMSKVANPVALFGIAAALMSLGLSVLFFGGSVALIAAGFGVLLFGIAALIEAITAFGTALSESIGGFGQIVGTFLVDLMTSLSEHSDELTEAGANLMTMFFASLKQSVTTAVEFGFSLLMAILEGIANGMGNIVATGMLFIENIILGIGAKLGDLISAAFQMVIMFIMGIADAFRTNRHMLENAVTDIMNTIGMAFLEGLASVVEGIPVFGADMAKGLRDQASIMEAAADDASQAVWDEFNKKHGDVISGTKATMADVEDAIVDGTPALENASGSAGEDVSSSFLESLGLNKGLLGEMNLSSDTIGQYAPILAAMTGQSAEDITSAWTSHIGGMSDATAEVSQDVGEQLSDNVTSGIDEHAADEKAGSLVVNATTTMENNTGKSEEAGKGLVTGLISGIDSLSYLAIERGKKLGADTAQSVKDGAQVESPSKITTSAGRYITMGVIVGMRSLEEEAVSTAEGIGLNTANAMAGMSQLIDSIDWDAHPTISPVFDGSEALRGLREFNSMIPQENIRAAGMMGYYPGGRALGISSNSSQQTNNTFNITLDWEAGMDANAMVMALGNALRSQSLMYA